jgi:outer membrane protein OmpA-like peptidoglycan-associated protein
VPPLTVDIDAFCTYGVIALVGAISALVATMAPFPDELKPHVWLVPSSWAVFLGYFAAPIVVFWLVDATGVSPDTSLITALVIAVSSQQLLGGSDPKIKIPQSVESWWQRFLTFSRSTTSRVQARSARDRRAFYEKIDAHLLRDDQAFEALRDYVRGNTTDLRTVDMGLQSIDELSAQALPAHVIRKRKGRFLLNQVAGEADIERRLKDLRVIPRLLYYWYLRAWRAVLLTLLVFALSFGTAAAILRRFLPMDWESSYALLRLNKSGATAADVHRAWKRLGRALSDPTLGAVVRPKVVAALQKPGLSLDRADLMVGLLLRSASGPGGSRSAVGGELALALRSASTDVPARVQDALVYLASLEPKHGAVDWKPLKETSTVDVERAVREWEVIWACPEDPNAASAQSNACAAPDIDKDGVPDRDDACPREPGIRTSDPKTNGCPQVLDSDQDTILDPDDACPTAPGPKNSDPKKNGCPEARLENNQIKTLDNVEFENNSAKITAGSDPILRAVVGVMKAHSELTTLNVEGYTDNRGAADYNMVLSQRRAAAVVSWLIDQGMERHALMSQGFGIANPVAGNDSEEGRLKNRRVEFHVTSSTTARTPEARGPQLEARR